MRLWHKSMIEFLPDMQLKGQWRECALIADGIQKNGTPNHLLVNKVMEYPYDEFATYCGKVQAEMSKRNFAVTLKSTERVYFKPWRYVYDKPIFEGWHNKEYLRVCYSNLYEKHVFGVGKSRITDEEWKRLADGYRQITGKEYVI